MRRLSTENTIQSWHKNIEIQMINKSLKYIFAKAGYIIRTPYGDIYLTSSLVERCLGSTQLLIGICAHEMTHYICKHSLIELWQTYKKEKSNRIGAEL